MDKLLKFVKELNEQQKEVHVTATHVLGHACAWGLYKNRKDIGRIRLGAFTRSKELGTTVLVEVGGGADLVPITIWDGHKMTLLEFAKACTERVGRAKTGTDRTHNRATEMAGAIPSHI